MGKGSRQRPDDGKYQDGWDRIFGEKHLDKKTIETVQRGIQQAREGKLTDGPKLNEERNDD